MLVRMIGVPGVKEPQVSIDVNEEPLSSVTVYVPVEVFEDEAAAEAIHQRVVNFLKGKGIIK